MKHIAIFCTFTLIAAPSFGQADTYELSQQGLAKCTAFVANRDFAALATYGEAILDEGQINLVA
ncbi:MAG: hypothetical protein ACPG5U_12005 [Planktomarina sp.]